MPRRLPIEDIRPTQLYLSSEKLAGVIDWFDFDSPNYEPLPVFSHDGKWYLSDGHTRAFTAWLAGTEQLRIRRDPDVRETYDFDVYRTCIEWCAESGVERISDLSGRVVEPATYERVWIERCKAVAAQSDDN